jgi:hypothetical protein
MSIQVFKGTELIDQPPVYLSRMALLHEISYISLMHHAGVGYA